VLNTSRVRIQGVDVAIQLEEGVFAPTVYGLAYAEYVVVHPGARVVDLGTGTGVLAVMAAKLGGLVSATDVDPRAVAAAQRCAQRNGVEVDCRLGSLFADLHGTFDVIIANLPNEIVAPAHLASVSANEARTFDGGPRGNAVILALLGAARSRMRAKSRLYLPVSAMTDYHAVLAVALRHYRVRLLGWSVLPVKSFVDEHIDYYRALNDAGVVNVFRQDERWHTYDYVYELTLPGLTGGAA
jgi:release factor glutamine methyltransferase